MESSEAQKLLDDYISQTTLEGFVVVHRNSELNQVVIRREGEKVNHLLHLILVIITFSFWIFVWLFLVFTRRKEVRIRVTIKEDGKIVKEVIKS